MRINHISFQDVDGAGNGAIRIHQSLLEIGVDSHFYSWRCLRRNIKNNYNIRLNNWKDCDVLILHWMFNNLFIEKSFNLNIPKVLDVHFPNNWNNKYKNKVYPLVHSNWMTTIVDNAKVISYPLDIKKFKYNENKIKDKFKVLFICAGENIQENIRKGIEYFIKTINNFKNIDVYLLGYINESFLKDFNDNNNIYLIRKTFNNNKIVDLYNWVDVTIIPSLFEPFGQVATESMACATPVIAFPSGGLNEIVKNKYNGILTSDKSIESLKETIRWSINNRDILKRMGLNGRRYVEEKYTFDVLSKQYFDFYKEVYNDYWSKLL